MSHTGSWSITSESDPRWNATGRSDSLFAFSTPPEVLRHVEKCKAEYGDMPKDLALDCMKD